MSLEVEILLRVLLAAVLGAAVGYDRQRSHKPAGVRTHMLVALGSALFVGSGVLVLDVYTAPLEVVRLDILRVTAAVATGIGFLGAGAILRGDGTVHGLTTAAGIWVTAGIGLAAGLGQIVLAVGATVLAVVVIAVLSLGRGASQSESGDEESV
ncbi:MAG: MgtC/SapB family protein [Acidimicrobiia bacterium]